MSQSVTAISYHQRLMFAIRTSSTIIAAPLYRDVSSDFTLCAAVSRYHQIVEILASWPFTRTYIKERDHKMTRAGPVE